MPNLGFGDLQNQTFRVAWEGSLARDYRQKADGRQPAAYVTEYERSSLPMVL